MEKLREEFRGWRERAAAQPERRQAFRNDVGMEIEPVYTPLHLEERGFDYVQHLGLPGEFPFTRGITPNMYRAQPPNIRVYLGYGTAVDTNQRLKKVLDWGAEEIQLAVDLPTQVGYDSDNEMAAAEVGRVGVAIDSLQDMEEVFRDVPLNTVRRVSMLGNSFGPIALSLFLALGEKQGLSPSEYVVDLQNDVLKEYIARGTQIYPVEPAMRLSADVVEYCARNGLHHWYPLTICINHINAAGAGSSAGAGFALANARCYIDELLSRNLSIDDFAHLLDMFVDERDDFFVAIANIRATRRVWAQMMRATYGARNPAALALRLTAYAHGRETLQEPINNIVRIAFATLAYYLGGVQFLYNASFDEVLSTPSEESVRVAIRTQQILAEELGFGNTVDPLGGSYYLESLTSDIQRDIMTDLNRVTDMGGSMNAIENGFFQRRLTEGAVRRQREFDSGERVSVGVNKYVSKVALPNTPFRIDWEVEKRQREALARVKAARDDQRVKETLAAVHAAADRRENVVPTVLEAVRAYATVGEICDVFRSIHGEFKNKGHF